MSTTTREPWITITPRNRFGSPAEISLGVAAGYLICQLAQRLTTWFAAQLAANRQRQVMAAMTPECRKDLEALLAATRSQTR